MSDEEREPILTPSPLPENLQSTEMDDDDDEVKVLIRKKLQWFFKTPFEKYKESGRKPFKFLLQIIKIIVITVQATLFAVDEFSLVRFNNNNLNMFRSSFIPQYAGAPVKKLFSKEMVYNHIMFAWRKYYNFDQFNTGPYEALKVDGKNRPIRFCKTWNNRVRNLVEPTALSIEDEYQSTLVRTECHDLKAPSHSNENLSLHEFVANNRLPVRMGWILSMSLVYSFQMNYTFVQHDSSPDCYHFIVEVFFDNQDLDGIMTVVLNSEVDYRICAKSHSRTDLFRSSQSILDVVLLVLCSISTGLCLRSFRKHYVVYQETKRFFLVHRGEDMKFSDAVVFVNFWMIMMVVSDVSALAGSSIKIAIDLFEHPELYTSCSVLFGVAVLFAWIGVLRNLGYIQGYNTLLITLKVALPSILRFTCCVSFIYFGFTICGWIVFGPYHPKFSGILAASECLFSLINGDDMWTTFNEMRDVQEVCPLIYFFSKIYLYVFISLFIFVVLSLFIGIVGDTFERIKKQGCAPKTRLEVFMSGGDGDDADVRESNTLLESTCTCFYKGGVRV